MISLDFQYSQFGRLSKTSHFIDPIRRGRPRRSHPMSSENDAAVPPQASSTDAMPTQPSPQLEPAAIKLPRIWPALMLLAVLWSAYAVFNFTEVGPSWGFFGFLILIGFGLLTTLLFLIWWLTASRTGRAE